MRDVCPTLQGMISWVFTRIARGSRFWAWFYGNLRVVMVKSCTREAWKAAAQKAAPATTDGAHVAVGALAAVYMPAA